MDDQTMSDESSQLTKSKVTTSLIDQANSATNVANTQSSPVNTNLVNVTITNETQKKETAKLGNSGDNKKSKSCLSSNKTDSSGTTKAAADSNTSKIFEKKMNIIQQRRLYK